MTARALLADAVVAGDDLLSPGWVTYDRGLLTGVGAGEPPVGVPTERVPGTLLPGFVDMHVHGGGGTDFSAATPESVAVVTATHLAHGTTSLLASLVTEPVDRLTAQIAHLAGHVESGALAGIHLEGPFLSPARCGAHDPALLRDPSPEVLAALLAAGRGTVRMVTLAPEREGGLDAVRRLVGAGVVAAVGHTDATAQVCASAFDAGATVATHLFNGMRPVHEHRDGGPVVAALLDDRVTLELIHDGVHVARETVALVRRLARSRVALITDAMAAAGAGDGEFTIGALPVHVEDGVAMLADGETLAGSTLTLDRALSRLVDEHGASLVEAARAVASTPARALGLDDRGILVAGRRADLVVLVDGAVTRVMRAGSWVA